MRKDLQPLRAGDETSTGLRILTARRADKAADRAINRLQARLLEYFPAPERAFDDSGSKAALLLLPRHRTPDGIRRTGQARFHAWLKKHGTCPAAGVAEADADAARGAALPPNVRAATVRRSAGIDSVPVSGSGRAAPPDR